VRAAQAYFDQLKVPEQVESVMTRMRHGMPMPGRTRG
jgi:hypothetical protein